MILFYKISTFLKALIIFLIFSFFKLLLYYNICFLFITQTNKYLLYNLKIQMGGHGGLNILPQKKWNVYNYDNRDIVQKDKKQHAQKTRKNYQSHRKHTMQKKFDVLKGQESITQRKQQNLKQSYKKDSILNNQFQRLAQQNQHVNLFQHEQKIIENRETLQYHKMKQSEWLKDKDIDYSSKFLGTYNDDGKMPWYAKSKDLAVKSNGVKEEKKMKRQRYDMQDLTDKVRLEKIQSKRKSYFGQNDRNNQFQTKYEDNKIQIFRKNQGQINVKRQFNDERQRSRHKKYEFIKQRQTTNEKNQKDQLNSKKHQQNIDSKNTNNFTQQKILNGNEQNIEIQKQTFNQLASNQAQLRKNSIEDDKNNQVQLLRLKRLKRQQKQRRKAQQLRKKLQQAINRN